MPWSKTERPSRGPEVTARSCAAAVAPSTGRSTRSAKAKTRRAPVVLANKRRSRRCRRRTVGLLSARARSAKSAARLTERDISSSSDGSTVLSSVPSSCRLSTMAVRRRCSPGGRQACSPTGRSSHEGQEPKDVPTFCLAEPLTARSTCPVPAGNNVKPHVVDDRLWHSGRHRLGKWLALLSGQGGQVLA
jgi:hypothetical protein